MGLFDTIKLKARCPYCNTERKFEFQTKALGCGLRIYKEGDKISSPDLEIYEGLIKGCIESCPNCKNIFYADVLIRSGKVHEIKELKRRD